MNKIGAVIKVIAGMFLLYLFLLVVMPVVSNMASTANTTIASSGVNVTAHPGSTSFLLASPWILWFAPAAILIAVIIVIMKRR